MKQVRFIAIITMVYLAIILPVWDNFAEGTESPKGQSEARDVFSDNKNVASMDLEGGTVANAVKKTRNESQTEEGSGNTSLLNCLASKALVPWICTAFGLIILAGVNLKLAIRLSKSIHEERQRLSTFAGQQGGKTIRCD